MEDFCFLENWIWWNVKWENRFFFYYLWAICSKVPSVLMRLFLKFTWDKRRIGRGRLQLQPHVFLFSVFALHGILPVTMEISKNHSTFMYLLQFDMWLETQNFVDFFLLRYLWQRRKQTSSNNLSNQAILISSKFTGEKR